MVDNYRYLHGYYSMYCQQCSPHWLCYMYNIKTVTNLTQFTPKNSILNDFYYFFTKRARYTIHSFFTKGWRYKNEWGIQVIGQFVSRLLFLPRPFPGPSQAPPRPFSGPSQVLSTIIHVFAGVSCHDCLHVSFCRWVDGSAFDFVAWLENEPSAHGGFENCGEIWHHAGNDSNIYELKNSLWLWFCSWVNGAPFYFVLWDRDEPSNHKSIGELCAAMKPKTGMLALPSMTDVL